MKIHKLVVKGTNSYILYDEQTLEAIIIDPGFESEQFIKFIKDNNLCPKEIVLTHHHYDHIGAAADLKEKYACILSIHKNDANGIKNPSINLSKKGLKKEISIIPDKILLDKDTLKVSSIVLKVIHTPGHTQGSISLKVKNQNIIFTGDTLFTDGIGRWDLPGGDEHKMINSIRNKISMWDDNSMIYPGHGEHAPLWHIKNTNPEYLYIMKNY